MKHKFTIEYEGMNGKREFANTDELLVNGDSIEHMIVVPKGATNGDAFKAMFPNLKVEDNGGSIYVHYPDGGWIPFDREWWNAPYKEEVE